MLTVTNDNFETLVLSSDKPVILDFFATWCGPCRAMHPLLVKMAEEHPEYVFAQTDVDENPELAGRFSVMSIPTLKIFSGGQLMGGTVGLTSEEELLSLIRNALEG